MRMMIARFTLALAAVTLATAACTPHPPVNKQHCYDPQQQLDEARQALEAARAAGCREQGVPGGVSCSAAMRDIERLATICPGHGPTLMANAVLAYDDGYPAKAQQFLDQLLERPGGQPDAAVLRARIAIEEGNVPFARKFVEQQILLSPDHAGLREVQGAALYLSGRVEEARQVLSIAQQLGAPAWRIAYHLGLIEESQGHFDEAAAKYTLALQGNPQWPAAQARLNAIRARRQH
jgi:tetratricopeptide (TPR) repeat protein